MRIQLTKITLAVSIILAMAFTFSFSQENLPTPTEKPIVYDTVTVRRVIADSITVDALKNVETFYSNSFKDIQNSYNLFLIIIGVLVAIIVGLLIFFNRHTTSGLEKEIRGKLEEQQKLFNEELEKYKNKIVNEQKKEIKESLEKDKEEIQDRFSILFRPMSRRHHELARERLKKGEFSWYYFDMHIFCRCLKEIRLNKTDLKKLVMIHNSFMKEPKKGNIEDRPTLIQNMRKILLNVYEDDEPEKKKFFCWFVESLLEFIEHCDSECHDTEQKPTEKLLYEEFYGFAKSIYNDICGIIGYDKIKKELNEHLIDKPDEILKLAENYRDKSVGINTK
jgi:hypothetical protein